MIWAYLNNKSGCMDFLTCAAAWCPLGTIFALRSNAYLCTAPCNFMSSCEKNKCLPPFYIGDPTEVQYGPIGYELYVTDLYSMDP